MAIGRISGPLLKANLLRNGVDLAFETDLLYLDVINGRVGIKTKTPSTDLHVAGTTRTTDLEVTNQADLATFTFLGNIISSSSNEINLLPSGVNPVVYQGTIITGDLQLSTNLIETTGTDTDLVIQTTGTGSVIVGSVIKPTDVLITGSLHATGNITADGNITIGDVNTDNITFNADISSNLNPDQNNTFDLGSDPGDLAGSNPLLTGNAWKNIYAYNLLANTVNADNIVINGVDLRLPQGNIYYVAINGDDDNSGERENNPVRTVKHALTLASFGDTVYIYPGVYEEEFPLLVPQGVTVKGTGIRAVFIQPTTLTETEDAFLINGDSEITDLTVTNFKFSNVNNTGYAFKLATSYTITSKNTLIQNVSVVTYGSTIALNDPYGFDSNDAGKGALLDGSAALTTTNPVIVFNNTTFITPNQESITVTNGVRIEWNNSYTYFADKSIYAYSGSTGVSNNGVTRLRLNSLVGSWNIGDTVSYYDTDRTTVIASGVIENISGNYVSLTGKCSNFDTVIDRNPKTIFVQGSAVISTAQSKFGSSSLYLNNSTGAINATSYVTIPAHEDFHYGTDDFTIEFWIYRTSNSTTNQFVIDQRLVSTAEVVPVLYISSGNVLSYVVAGVTVITGSVISLNTWTHVALSKNSGNTRLFLNGAQAGVTYIDSNNYVLSPITIGTRFNFINSFQGFIDDLRITKSAGKYTASFAVPVSQLLGDKDTVLLLNFNGSNNSTSIIDNNIVNQDVRTSSTGTSTLLEAVDYSDFGAEIKCTGSSSSYGNYGIYGSGEGVSFHLISHSFFYVGAGKLSTNNDADQIESQQIIKLSKAKVYYTSLDNVGRYKVGDLIKFDQALNEITFESQLVEITAPSGVIVTNGVSNTEILATSIGTGNIRISSNTVESITGDVNISAASGTINLQNNTVIIGDLDVSGNVTISGNTQLGNQSSDTINFVGGINSSLIPLTNETWNLGSISPTILRWKNVYLNRAEIDGLIIDNNSISTTIGNDDLQLIANGTGKIYIPFNDVQVDQNLTVTQDFTVTTGSAFLKNVDITGNITQTGNVNQTGDFTSSGNTTVTGNITGTGYLQLPDIKISANVIETITTNTDLIIQANGTGDVIIEDIRITDNNIQSITSNANITLTPQGLGSVVIDSDQSLLIPVGTTLERPATPTVGMIRYNTTLSRFEGRVGSYWTNLSGVEDISGTTKILPELSPGSNENTLYFYANNNLTVTIDSTKLYTQRFHTNNLDIYDNTITTLLPNSDINISTPGTGGVKIGNLRFHNNTITNVQSGGITEFVETGTGYVKIGGVQGFVIPAGDSGTDRPSVKETGMTRFNTELQLVEIWTGSVWTTVAGTTSGINAAEATDIGIQTILMLG